jgi:ABC-type bacteriocin/lantibiotic exporter with double-glycine peptidase domain
MTISTAGLDAGDGCLRDDEEQDLVLAAFRHLCELLNCPRSVAELRVSAPVIGAALGARDLLTMGERLGLRGRLERSTRRRLEQLPVPFLLLGRRPGEAWVVRGRTGRHLVLVEPHRGVASAHTARSVVRMAGAALLFRLAEPTGAVSRSSWRQALRQRLWRPLAEVALASAVINLLALATPLFMMTVYNRVISHAALQTLDVLAIGMLSLFVFELMLRALRGHVASHTGARLDVAIGGEVVHRLLQLPYRAFEGAASGALVERVRQLDQLRGFLTGQLPLLLVDLAFVGLFVVALLVLAPTLAWLTVAAMPLFVLLSAAAHRRQRSLGRAAAAAATQKAACLGEAVGQALTVKGLGLEPAMERRFERRLVDSAWASFRAGSLANVVGSLGQALQHLTALGIVYVGARQIVAGDLSIGALVAANILSGRALAPMRQVFLAWQQVQQAREILQHLDGVLATPAETLRSGAGDHRLRGSLRLENVTFRYAGSGQAAIDGLSLEIEPGTMIGVLGAPGSGKSTLVKLLLGLETPTEGRILVDGVDLRQIAPAAYRGQVGTVPQEIQLFAGTIADNIGIGALDRSPARIVAAAKFAGIHDTVQGLPDGYDTVLGAGGVGLSMGQRQLLAIARALLRNPLVLVLDEATSALDSASEACLLRNLRRAGRGRTIVMVTHRRSVLAACDRAILLQAGRVLRAGSPGEIAGLVEPARRRAGLHAVS